MSSILSKIAKNKYKTLYETELNNRKLIEKRYNELKKENIELQKSSGIAELRKENMKLQDEINELNIELKLKNKKYWQSKCFEYGIENKKLQDEVSFLKEDRAKLYVQLEDLRNEKEMKKSGTRRKKEVLHK